MRTPLVGISSMATRQVLAALAEAARVATGIDVAFESVGGVDAARRVRSGTEVFDLVVLANDAMDALASSAHVMEDSRRAIVDSTVAIAVRAGTAAPDIGSEAALRSAVMNARSIGYSTGPSGKALLALFDRWGLGAALSGRLVQAPAGVAVGSLLADGRAELGFQQLSELMDVEGITLIGRLPPGMEIVTPFVGALGAGSTRQDDARRLLDFMVSPATDALKRRHGMAPAEAR